MSVRILNAAGITLGCNPTVGGDRTRATVAFRLRFNWPPTVGGNFKFIDGKLWELQTTTAVNETSKSIRTTSRWLLTSGTSSYSDYIAGNRVHQIVMTWDAADVSKQAVYIDGVKFPTTANTLALSASAAYLKIGSFVDSLAFDTDLEVEGLLYVVGYAATEAEATAIFEGADPSTIGPDAEWRNYWPLTGTEGSAIEPNDPGIANAIDLTAATPTLFTGTQTGSGLVYGANLQFTQQGDSGDFAVYSNGTSVRVGFRSLADGEPVKVVAGSLVTPPKIRIDGGSEITLERPLYDTDFVGALMFTPPGVVIPPGAAVTITTVKGWISTVLEPVAGVTDAEVVNRSGLPVYGDQPPTLRVGGNNSYSTAYWHYGYGLKNLATRAQVTEGKYALRDDQTLMQPVKVLTVSTGFDDALDATNAPRRRGMHAVQYDDTGDDNATAIALTSSTNTSRSGVTEVMAYHNPGDANGVGKGAVYLVEDATWPLTLAAPCGASDTVLSLVSAADVLTVAVGGEVQQYVKWDDEYVLITAVDKTAKTITVDRAYLGTTAAAHAGGAVGEMKALESYYSLSLDFSNSVTGIPSYKNLAVFGPADFTLPDPPGPIVLDRSPENMHSPSADLVEVVSRGCGIVRQMDSTSGGFDEMCEVEHMRVDSDLWPGEVKHYDVECKVTLCEPVTATLCPFAYIHYYMPGAVKYPVVLAADVTTAPAAGTQETIKITADPANPVMFGQRIEMPSTELVRVLTVDGDDVLVVRGADGTTPAIQAAGTVQARWRTPIADASQYEIKNGARVRFTTAENHNLWTGCLATLPSSNDLNPLARFNVTLLSDVAATDDAPDAARTTIRISVDPENAQYVADGLLFSLDDEMFQVRTFTPDAAETPYVGEAYVIRHAGSSGPGRPHYPSNPAADHVAGTVGTASSGGVFCVSDDGLSHAWSSMANFKMDVVVTGPRTFMAWMGGFIGGEVVWRQVGDQPKDVIVDDAVSYVHVNGPGAVFSWKQAARLGKYAPGAIYWLNVPMNASDDLVDAIARDTRDGLPAGEHEIYVELSNEVWNLGGFRQVERQEFMQLFGFTDAMDPWTYRSWAVKERVKAVFAEAGRGGEVKLVLAWQQGGVDDLLASAGRLGLVDEVEAVSTAPYFRPFDSTAIRAAYEAATDEECLDIWKFILEYDRSNIGKSLAVDGAALKAVNLSSGRTAAGNPIKFIHYEGGPDSFMPSPSDVYTNGHARNIDLNYNPNCYNAVYDFPYILNRVGGSEGIAFFYLFGAPAWDGLRKVYSLWLINEWSGQQAGRGDGSDGKADNRLWLAQPGKAHTKPANVAHAEPVVSVRAQALYDYKAEFESYLADPGGWTPPGGGSTPDPDPDPDPTPTTAAPARKFVPSRGGRSRRRR